MIAAARKEALEKGVLKILLKLATSGDEDTEELQQSALETLAAFAEQGNILITTTLCFWMKEM